MRSIAHFSIRICAEASQILGIEIPYWDFYSGADAEQRSINYAAGFFGAVWAAYRGMWKNAFILLGLEALYSFLLNLAALFLIRLYPEWQLKVLFWGLHLCIFGILGEKMYFNHVFGLLRSVKNRTASMEGNIFPDRYCGTHVGYALLMTMMQFIVNFPLSCFFQLFMRK